MVHLVVWSFGGGIVFNLIYNRICRNNLSSLQYMFCSTEASFSLLCRKKKNKQKTKISYKSWTLGEDFKKRAFRSGPISSVSQG